MKYLGIDYGLKRVGLALSEGEFASAWKIIEINGLENALNQISVIVTKEEIDQIVVGMPEGEMGKVTKKFVNALGQKDFNVITTEETLSSQNATRLMIDLGVSKKGRKRNDDIAAADILQNYLDSKY